MSLWQVCLPAANAHPYGILRLPSLVVIGPGAKRLLTFARLGNLVQSIGRPGQAECPVRIAHDGGIVLGPDNIRYRDRSHGVLEEGMIFTLEPVVGPVGLEDEVIVTANGAEFLFPSQKAIYLV